MEPKDRRRKQEAGSTKQETGLRDFKSCFLPLASCFLFLTFLILLAACGGQDTDFSSDVPTASPPVVSRIDPDTGAAGVTITIFGFGFSNVPQNNIVIIGGAAVAATGYSLVDSPTATEIERITAEVPSDATAGVNSVAVMVHSVTSNQDIQFTVTP